MERLKYESDFLGREINDEQKNKSLEERVEKSDEIKDDPVGFFLRENGINLDGDVPEEKK